MLPCSSSWVYQFYACPRVTTATSNTTIQPIPQQPPISRHERKIKREEHHWRRTIDASDNPRTIFHRYKWTSPWRIAEMTTIRPGQMWYLTSPCGSKGVWRETAIKKKDIVQSAIWPKQFPNSTMSSSSWSHLEMNMMILLGHQNNRGFPIASLLLASRMMPLWVRTPHKMTQNQYSHIQTKVC